MELGELIQDKLSFKKVLDIDTIIIGNSILVFSLYIPLGENGIIELNDRFRLMREVEILDTDLYYFIKIRYNSFIIEFYSRGLIEIELTVKESSLNTLINEAHKFIGKVHGILMEVLTEYNLSIVEVLGNINSIPVHKTIVIDDLMNQIQKSEERRKIIKTLSENPKVLSFIGDPRSINSASYEDVIIGTEGSIVRSDDIKIMISFHAYIRALHLFLRKYNLIIEKVWKDLNTSENQVNELDNFIMNENQQEKRIKDKFHIFSSSRRKKLGKTRHDIFHRIKHIDNFLVLTNFINESIDFTRKKFQKIVSTGVVKQNSFDIRKLLDILDDRVKHFNIVSQSFATRGRIIISQLDLFDSEIASETEERLQTIAFLIGFLGMALASVAIFVQLFQ